LRTLLRISPDFWRALGPALAAAAATGLGALAAVGLAGRFVHGGWRDVEMLTLAIAVASLAYGAVVFVFRRPLALGRRA
jgi:hypothetical protein